MRSMMGVLEPTSGGTYIDDREVGTWDRRELARAVGVVAQSETLSFPLTVREMVAMGRYPHLGLFPVKVTPTGRPWLLL